MHLKPFREVFLVHAKEGFLEQMSASMAKYNSICARLTKYYLQLVEEKVRSSLNTSLAPPSGARKQQQQLSPAVLLKLRSEDLAIGPVSSRWKIRGSARPPTTCVLKAYRFRLNSAKHKGRTDKVNVPGCRSGDLLVALAPVREESDVKYVEGKTFGANKVEGEAWAAKKAVGIFEATCESLNAAKVSKLEVDRRLTLKLAVTPGMLSAAERTDLPTLKMFNFRVEFFDTGEEMRSAHYMSATGFLMDGTPMEHKVGVCGWKSKEWYCFCPPEGTMRANSSSIKGRRTFNANSYKDDGEFEMQLMSPSKSRQNTLWVTAPVRRTKGWHTFVVRGASEKVRRGRLRKGE